MHDKLWSLGYPSSRSFQDSFENIELEQLCLLVIWIEDRKIRLYQPNERELLRKWENQHEYARAFDKVNEIQYTN